MDLDIRKLTKKETSQYRSLRHMGFQESPTAFSESLEDETNEDLSFFEKLIGFDSDHFTAGAFIQNELVGIATFKRDKRFKARHKSFIHTMYVAPRFRRQKISEKILHYLLENARAMPGLEQTHLWVLNPQTSAAKKLYAKMGFIAQGAFVKRDLKFDDQYLDAEYMTLQL